MSGEFVVNEQSWVLAIDYGTTGTAAASGPGRAEMVNFDGNPTVTSAVLVAGDGSLVVGEPARSQTAASPERVENTPKRRLGGSVLLLGDGPVDPTDLVAATLGLIKDEAFRRHGGQAPAVVRLTHPVRWAGRRIEALREAARRAGLGEVELLAEPVAAALHLADPSVAVGDRVAVFDLGGGTLDIAVLVRTAEGFAVIGSPGGDDQLGGEVFDELLYRHIGSQIQDPEVWQNLQSSDDRVWIRANHQFRVAVRQAKEALSTNPDYLVYLPSPVDVEIRVTREEFEGVIRADVERAADELVETLDRTGVGAAGLSAIYLVGGSSRIPLVGRVVADRTGITPTTWGDPKGVVALGAAGASFGSALPATAHDADPTLQLVALDPASPYASAVVSAAATGWRRFIPATTPARISMAAAAVLVVLALVGGVVLATRDNDKVVTKGDGPARTTTTAPATTTTEAPTVSAGKVTFASATLTNGATAEREWAVDPVAKTFTGRLAVANPLAAPTSTFHVEVVPKEIAASASQIEMLDGGQPFTVIKDDPVIAWDLDLAAGETKELRYIVRDLATIPDDATLTRLSDEANALQQTEVATRLPAFCATRTCVADTTTIPGDTTTTGAVPVAVGGNTTVRPGTTARPGGTSGTASPGSTGGGNGTQPQPQITQAPVVQPPTPQIDPPSAPQSVFAKDPVSLDGGCSINNDKPNTRFTLTWSAPASNGGATVSGYRITVTQKNKPSNSQSREVGAGTTVTQFDVPHFNEDAYYETTVQAINSAGAGASALAVGIVPNLVGQCTWTAYPMARAVGLKILESAPSPPPSMTVSGQIWTQSTSVGTKLSPGSVINAQSYCYNVVAC